MSRVWRAIPALEAHGAANFYAMLHQEQMAAQAIFPTMEGVSCVWCEHARAYLVEVHFPADQPEPTFH